jgi:hypothetical protein
MAHSKVRWISTPVFLACVGGAHGRREGANVCEKARTTEVGARTAEGGGRTNVCAPRASVCAPQPAVCAPPTSICAPPATVCVPQSSVCTPYVGVCAPPTSVCAPQPAECTRSNPDHPMWQRYGSDVAATMNKVSPDIPCSRSTRR